MLHVCVRACVRAAQVLIVPMGSHLYHITFHTGNVRAADASAPVIAVELHGSLASSGAVLIRRFGPPPPCARATKGSSLWRDDRVFAASTRLGRVGDRSIGHASQRRGMGWRCALMRSLDADSSGWLLP